MRVVQRIYVNIREATFSSARERQDLETSYLCSAYWFRSGPNTAIRLARKTKEANHVAVNRGSKPFTSGSASFGRRVIVVEMDCHLQREQIAALNVSIHFSLSWRWYLRVSSRVPGLWPEDRLMYSVQALSRRKQYIHTSP